MNDPTLEQLSALLDDELPRDELRFLLRRLDNDAELAARWSRFQVASSVLRRQYAAPLVGDRFATSVLARIDGEAAIRPQRRVGARVLRWAGGGAIAAAVAVVALVSVRPGPTDGAGAADVAASGPSARAATFAAAAPAPVGELHQPLAPQQVTPVGLSDYAQPASFERFGPAYSVPRYLGGQAAGGDSEQFVPYVLVVGSRQAPANGGQRTEPLRLEASPTVAARLQGVDVLSIFP
jgi:sigma-E factor negative regulatory protein RseA